MHVPEKPDWLFRVERLIPLATRAAYERAYERKSTPDLNAVGACAALHLAQCLDASIQANKHGHHSVAVALLRHCIEALTVVELSLLPESAGDELLTAWKNDSKQGAIRKELEKRVWPRYGVGLWGEPWSSHFAELARAVQPYAHYSPMLQAWQLALMPDARAERAADGSYLLLAQVGPFTYDPSKASRITALQAIVVWTLARLLIENGSDPRVDRAEVAALGAGLAESPLLGKGTLTWHHQFWAHEFDLP